MMMIVDMRKGGIGGWVEFFWGDIGVWLGGGLGNKEAGIFSTFFFKGIG